MRALSKMRDKPFEFHIIGDGAEHESLAALSRELEINEHMVWHGWQSEPWNVITSATCLLLSSVAEPFGLVLIEALARGIPVLSSNCKYGPREIINASNGWLYESNDLEQLTSILHQIFDGSCPFPSQEACRASVRKYDVRSITERFEQALAEIVDHRTVPQQ